MKSSEPGILETSDLYFYTPSHQARNLFLIPLCVGHFYYEKAYSLNRSNYDSFLLMYIQSGCCYIKTSKGTELAKEKQVIFLDCYQPHSYYTTVELEALWIHFDGITAREYYNLINAQAGNVITLKDTLVFEKNLSKIYDMFHNNSTIKEPLISKYIITMLTDLIMQPMESSQMNTNSSLVEEIITYMNDNIRHELSIDTLAKKASLSPYYFIRIFKSETGFTPHEYIIASRINLAKFTLKTTNMTIKEIAFHCGFTSESCFCTTFKKWVKMTPKDYRSSNL